MKAINLHYTRICMLIISIAILGIITYALFATDQENEHHKSVPAGSNSLGEPAQQEASLRSGPGAATYHAEQPGNYEPAPVQPGDGPGEGGRPLQLPGGARGEAEYGMNMAVSDSISLDRTVPDTRHPECRHWDYPEDLPSASVVIVFHNEGFSTLMRTVHSVVNRSPARLLREVLLVDDFSDKADLGDGLERYLGRFGGLVRLHRNSERQGLIRTRSRGAALAAGDVVLFLDAHCEVNVNWLPPLLAPIAANRTTMTVPIVDGVDHSTFQYRPVYRGTSVLRGIFEWGMLYKETAVPARERSQHQRQSEPYRAPTHAGGLFAIDRSYFLELGGYDPGLLVWGGENFELSFKVWQCGGSILWVPCSRVGHVYRGHMPYSFGTLAQKVKGPLILRNYKRVIETWFDERHKAFFYAREPLAQYLDAGDISAQLAFRRTRGCRSFQWYMEEVAYDVLEKFPELPPNRHWGELVSVSAGLCVDAVRSSPGHAVSLSACHGQGGNQLLRLNSAGQLGVGERCLREAGTEVVLAVCPPGTADGPWRYDTSTETLVHTVRRQCVAEESGGRGVRLETCDSGASRQRWQWQDVRPRWARH